MQARAERAVFFADQFGPAAPRRAKLLFLARFHLPPIGRDEHGFAQLSSCPSWQLPSRHSSLPAARNQRSEEHTSELQSLMRISYAVFCLKKNTNSNHK